MRVCFPMSGYTTSGLSFARQQQSESLQSIALGEKKFLSSEDSGAYSVSLKLSNLKKYEKGFHNGLQNAVSISHTQQAALERMRDILYRISELSSLAVGSKPRSTEREQCQAQYEALASDFDEYSDYEVNGVRLFGFIKSEDKGASTDADYEVGVASTMFVSPDLLDFYTQRESLIDGLFTNKVVHLIQIQHTYSEKLAAGSYPPSSSQISTLFTLGIVGSSKVCNSEVVFYLWCFVGSLDPVSYDQLKAQFSPLLRVYVDGDGATIHGEKHSISSLTLRFLHPKNIDAGANNCVKHITFCGTDKFVSEVDNVVRRINPYFAYPISKNSDSLVIFKAVYGQTFIDGESDEIAPIPLISGEGIIFQMNTISSLSFGDYGVSYMANANGIGLIPRCVDEVTHKTWGISSQKEKGSNNIEGHSNISSANSSASDSSNLVTKDESISEQIKCLLYDKILNDRNFSTSSQEVLMPRNTSPTFYSA